MQGAQHGERALFHTLAGDDACFTRATRRLTTRRRCEQMGQPARGKPAAIPPPHTHAQNAAFCAPMSALLTRSRALVAGKPTTMISTCCAEPVDGSATQDAGVGRDSCRLSTPFPGPQALSAHVLCSFGRMQHAGMSPCSTCPPQMCVCACRPHACREPTRRRALCCCLEHALCACAPLSLHSCLCARAGHLAFE